MSASSSRFFFFFTLIRLLVPKFLRRRRIGKVQLAHSSSAFTIYALVKTESERESIVRVAKRIRHTRSRRQSGRERLVSSCLVCRHRHISRRCQWFRQRSRGGRTRGSINQTRTLSFAFSRTIQLDITKVTCSGRKKRQRN